MDDFERARFAGCVKRCPVQLRNLVDLSEWAEK